MSHSNLNDWSIPTRQPLVGLIILVYKAAFTIIKAIWPLLLVTLFRTRDKEFDVFEILLFIIPAIILLRSLFEFFYFSFYIAHNELVIKKGFLSKKTLAIPLEKIQSVNLEQSLLHQALKVVKVKIDTAGSEQTEATIDALDDSKAEMLKAYLLQNHQIHEPRTGTESSERQVVNLKFMDLLKLGLSANHIQAFFIVLAFAISMLQNLEEIFGNRVIAFVKESTSAVGSTITSIAFLTAIVLIISMFVSFVRVLLNYFSFNCSETRQGFRIQAGLLNTKQNLVPFSKIQYVSWYANWVRRNIGLYHLELHQVTGDNVSRHQKIKIPITRKEFIPEIIEKYHRDIRGEADSQHQINRVYPFRQMIIALFTTIPIVGITFIWFGSYSFLLFLLVPYILITATFYQRNFRLFIAPDVLQVYSGVWGRETQIVKWYKVQEVLLKQSIYQRRRQLANLELHTAGGTIRVPFISLELARMIQNYAMYKIESSHLKWM